MSWKLGGAGHPDLMRVIGHQEMVLASNFLFHMEAAARGKLLGDHGLVKRRGASL